jgi:hypothetical protein
MWMTLNHSRSDQNAETVAASGCALAALPVEWAIFYRIHVNVATTRAMDAFWPAARYEVGFAGILIREHAIKLLICKLFYRLDAGHIGLPYPLRPTYAI